MIQSWFSKWLLEINLHVYQEDFDLSENSKIVKHDRYFNLKARR